MNLALRPASDADRPFLLALYRSTREPEFDAVDWPPPVKEAFYAQQFEAQAAGHRQAHPRARFDVVLLDGAPVGRLSIDRDRTETHIVDIAVATEHRGRGIGRRLIGDLLAESDAAGIPVSLYVQSSNPARAWYQRLGFEPAEDGGVYVFHRRAPQPRRAAVS